MHALADYNKWSAAGLFLLVIIFLATYLLLTFYNPEFVRRKHGKNSVGHQNDPAVTLLWALFISIAILVVLGLLVYAFTCAY